MSANQEKRERAPQAKGNNATKTATMFLGQSNQWDCCNLSHSSALVFSSPKREVEEHVVREEGINQ